VSSGGWKGGSVAIVGTEAFFYCHSKNRAPAKDLCNKDFVGRGRATLALLQFEFTQIA
jgi:hypothetical protein